MTDDSGRVGEKGTSDTGGAKEWKRIFQDIGDQVRREAARSVGADVDADWTAIGRQTDEGARKNIARVVGLGEQAGWEEIGAHLEGTTRGGVARFVGASTDADWATVGQTVEAKVQAFFDVLFGSKAKSESPSEDDFVDPWE